MNPASKWSRVCDTCRVTERDGTHTPQERSRVATRPSVMVIVGGVLLLVVIIVGALLPRSQVIFGGACIVFGLLLAITSWRTANDPADLQVVSDQRRTVMRPFELQHRRPTDEEWLRHDAHVLPIRFKLFAAVGAVMVLGGIATIVAAVLPS